MDEQQNVFERIEERNRLLWAGLQGDDKALLAAFDHCEHGNRKGDFCMGCEQERMG